MQRFITTVALAAVAFGFAAHALASDQEVAQQMAGRLSDSGKLQGYRIAVKVQDSTAWLEGSVSNKQQMRDAMAVANSTPGIKRVVNNLSIENMRAVQYGVRQTGATDPAEALLAGGGEADPRAMPGTLPQRGPAPGMNPGMNPAMGRMPYGPQMASAPMPAYPPAMANGVAPARYDHPNMPGYAWPSYAAYPNYAAVTYPKQYSPTAWPFIGPFYPYPQVPLGWRKVTLEWDDGWWNLDFKD